MKISMWAVWVAILSLFFSISYGFDVCADSNIQTTPAISGTTVVWQDSRTGVANIYCRYLNGPNDFALSSSNNPQLNPDIDGNIVVWVEDGDIFGHDLATSARLEVCIDASTKETPAISGNLVVWAENNNGNYDIYGKYIGSGGKFLICGETGNQIEPAVDGNIVVWKDTRNGNDDIYGKNLSTGQIYEICNNLSKQTKPRISGNLVVWQDYRNAATGTDIYGCYLQQSDFAICTVANNQNYPDVCDDIVVWKDGDNIYYSDLSKDWNGTGYISYAITTGSNTMANPRISNYTVIWENQSVKNIYGAFLLLSGTTPLSIANPQAGQTIWNGKPFNIQWQADPNLIGVINIEISVDGGQNYGPIAVNVFDTGSYEWTPEESVNSENCRIRVTSIAGYTANGESGVFTVTKCSDKLTADFNGDCTVDMADFAAFSAQWMFCGNPYDDTCLK